MLYFCPPLYSIISLTPCPIIFFLDHALHGQPPWSHSYFWDMLGIPFVVVLPQDSKVLLPPPLGCLLSKDFPSHLHPIFQMTAPTLSLALTIIPLSVLLCFSVTYYVFYLHVYCLSTSSRMKALRKQDIFLKLNPST